MEALVSYLRVSTARQGSSGLGLDAQREAIRVFAAQRGLTLGREFVEIESGRDNARPVLASALRHARRTKSTLLVARLDRLSRSVSFIAAVLDANVDFMCANQPSANRLLLHVLSAVAEEEARAVSERTKAALERARARGVKLGAENPNSRNLSEPVKRRARRLGQAANRELARREYADLLPIMQSMRAEGKSLGKIADALNDQGATTRNGAAWTATQVKRVLDRG